MNSARFLKISLMTLVLALAACGRDFKGVERESDNSQNPEKTPQVTVNDISDEFIGIRPVGEEPTAIQYQEGESRAEGGFRLVRGRLDVENLTFVYEKSKKEMKLKGRFLFQGTEGAAKKVPFNMVGKLSDRGQVTLVYEGPEAAIRSRLKALATCSTENCDEFYIDFFYLSAGEKLIYTDRFIPKPKNEVVVTPAPIPAPAPSVDRQGEGIVTEPLPVKKEENKTPPTEEKKSAAEVTIPVPAKEAAPVQVPAPKIEVPKSEGDELDKNEVTAYFTQPLAPPKAEAMAELFPQIKADREKALEKKREQKRTPTVPPPSAPPPKSTEPSPVPQISAPLTPLSPLAGGQPFPDDIAKVLASIPPGLNQAVESVQVIKGRKVIVRRLNNPVSLFPLIEALRPNAGLQILRPQLNRFFGTSELVNLVLRIGQWVREQVPNVNLDVAELSDQDGGPQSGHESHQHGLDADLGYIFGESNVSTQLRKVNTRADNLILDKQWELFKALFSEGSTHLIIVSSKVKRGLCRLVRETNEINQSDKAEFTKFVTERIITLKNPEHDQKHENHFHLRVKCGPGQSFCRDVTVPLEPCR